MGVSGNTRTACARICSRFSTLCGQLFMDDECACATGFFSPIARDGTRKDDGLWGREHVWGSPDIGRPARECRHKVKCHDKVGICFHNRFYFKDLEKQVVARMRKHRRHDISDHAWAPIEPHLLGRIIGSSSTRYCRSYGRKLPWRGPTLRVW